MGFSSLSSVFIDFLLNFIIMYLIEWRRYVMKKVYWIIIGIVIALAAAGFIWFRSAYALIGGQIYDRNVTTVDFSNVELKNPGQLSRLKNLQHADLRHTDLSVKDYEKIRAALPDCEILWLVPFQGQRLDPESTNVTMTSATEEDIALLAHFPKLEVIDMTACSDTEAALKVMELYPQCKVQCMIPFQGQTIPYDTETLTISSLSQEDISMVRHFTELKSINAVACTDLDAVMELHAQYPDVQISWTVPVGSETYAGDTVELELADATAEEVENLLKYLPELKILNLTGKTPDNDTMLQLKEANPNVAIGWDFELCGVTVNTNATEIDLSEIEMESVDEVENSLKYFNNLEKVVMFKCGISSEDMDALWKRHPETRFVWGALIGGTYFRTDETTFMPWKQGYARDGSRGITDEECVELKYMVDMVCMDIGHQAITDLSFLYYMPNMEYLMFCETKVADITPVGSLKKLKFLEMWMTEVTDLSPLAGCTALEDINFTRLAIEDLTPLYDLPLQNIWLSRWKVSKESLADLEAQFPDAKIVSRGDWPTTFGWRLLPNNRAQRDLLEMFYIE